jgi:hypothetical protein
MPNPTTEPTARRRLVAIGTALLLMTAATARGDDSTVMSASTQNAADDCFVIDLVLLAPDSMVATVPQSRCGPLRLVLLATAQHYTLPGITQYERLFRLPFALENVGTSTFSQSLTISVDSVAPVQGGRQLNARYSGGFLREIRRIGSTKSELPPGGRSRGDTLFLATDPFTQGLRLWLNVAGAKPRRPVVVEESPARRDDGPAGSLVEQFVARSGLPTVRETRVVLRLREPDLVVFNTSYGEPQDCFAGCFYFGVTGLAYRGKIGWLRSDTAVRNPFSIAAADTFLFSVAFHDTIVARLGRYNDLDNRICSLLLQQPQVPRALLMRYLERVYRDVDSHLAGLLANSPAVERERDILAIIANLPIAGENPPFYGPSETAKEKLATLAPVLLRDSTTPARTLWILAHMRLEGDDSVIVAGIAQHPNARANSAILSALAVNHTWLRPNVVASLRASERIRRAVADLLAAPHPEALMRQLLDDPEAGTNLDVLLVLANRFAHPVATRRLPEGSLGRVNSEFVLIR